MHNQVRRRKIRGQWYGAFWRFDLSQELAARGFRESECWAYKCLYDLAVEYQTLSIPAKGLRMSYLKYKCPGCHSRTIKSAISKACFCPEHGPQRLPAILNERGRIVDKWRSPVDKWPFSVDNCVDCSDSCDQKLFVCTSSGNLTLCGTMGVCTDVVLYKDINNKHAVDRWRKLVGDLTSRLQRSPGNKQERRLAGLIRTYGPERVYWAIEQLPRNTDIELNQLAQVCAGNGHPFMGPLFERAAS